MRDKLTAKALERATQALSRFAAEMRKLEPEWKPGRVPAASLERHNQQKLERMRAELLSVSGRSSEAIDEAIATVQDRWGVKGFDDAALSHLLKLAKRGEWIDQEGAG